MFVIVTSPWIMYVFYQTIHRCYNLIISGQLQGVKIGEGAIIQAGSVVVSDIATCSIAGGHPAKVFKKRNEERYYELKQEESFF